MKKAISFMIIMGFVLGFMAACSSDSSTTDSEEDWPTIEFYTNEHPSWPTNEEWLVWELMEEGGKMEMDITIAADPYDESLNLVIASGELPDLIGMPNYTIGNRYGAQGALVNLLDHIDEMPHLQEWMDQFPEAARAALSHDGKMYVSPNHGIGETNRMLWLYRQDIFEEHGLEVPGNWEELHSVLQELKEIYPESYPLGFRNGIDKIRNFAANFGTDWEYYYDEQNEEWRYGPIEDNYRELVEYLHTFYQEDLIPSDFLSTDTAQWQELMSTDTSFITQDYISRIDTFNVANREENPDFTIVNMPPPAGLPGGEQRDYSSHTQQRGYSIAVDSDHIDTTVQFIDWTFSEEGRDALSWGIEGETYTEENGEKAWIEDYSSPSELRSETGLSLYATYSWFDYDSHMSLFSEEVKTAYEEDPQYDAPIVPVLAFSEDEQEALAIQGEAISKHRDEQISKFIVGDRDLSEWDAYVEEIQELGLQEMLDIHEAAYLRMQEAELE
ncbi:MULTISPECIES: extracellular solute-binding protein [Gracilibacillus]|uniref:extracellular solute-binding protein n=1 Tax=Gracilibacillus TaxID=74385 RepID=UPI0008250057|nr:MULTISPECIES: extracellular solute-binding protein [Gracilibacillus]